MKPEVDINQIVEKITTTLSLPFHIKKNEITIGASIGIGLYPQNGKTAEELLKYSDLAMYEAKTKKKTKNP